MVVEIWGNCSMLVCESITVRNVSDKPVYVDVTNSIGFTQRLTLNPAGEAMRDKWKTMTARQIEDAVDKGLRHRTHEPHKYLEQWLSIARDFARATHDDSWGEFEKEFAIIISSLVRAETRYERLVKALKKKRDDYVAEHFSTDPETGVSESSARKEYAGELDEMIEFIENFKEVCSEGCQYAKDVGMPESGCGSECQYVLAGRRFTGEA